MTEVWALRDGLALAKEENVKNLETQIDALVVIPRLISNDHHTENHQLGNILLDCRSLIEEFEEVSIKHFYRETNHCADILANDAPVLVEDLQKQKKLSTIIPLSRPLFT